MNIFKFHRNNIVSVIFTVIFITYCSALSAGGGGSPSLDTKEGLERAADNFLSTFAMLSIAKDTELTISNGIESSYSVTLAINLIEHNYSDDSLWHFFISNPNISPIPRSKDISSKEYRDFRNEYIQRKNTEYLKKQQEKLAN